MTVQFKQAWNREILPLGIIVVGTIERGRSILMVLHKAETPHALH